MHVIELPDWAVERGRTLNDFSMLEAAALVVVDMQNAFVAEDGVFGNLHARDIVPAVNRLAEVMRTAGAPVMWTRQTHVHEGPCAAPAWQYDLTRPEVVATVEALQAGAHGHALFPLMDVQASDLVVDKYRYGAFACPAGNLRRALEAAGTRMIVVAGTLTNVCCESTAREAYMAGFKVIVAGDATAAVTDAEHNAALLNLRVAFADVKTVAEVEALAGVPASPS